MTQSPRRVDLHTHTTASDGILTPTELVAAAMHAGLAALGVTDHDTMNGVEEALAASAGQPLIVVPGVELSTDAGVGEVHVLGYYLDPHEPELAELLTTLRGSRHDRGERMVAKLADLGMPLSWERVQEMSNGGAVGRPHVARAMLEAGHVGSVQEAFSRYIGSDGPAYVNRYRLTALDATALIRRLGGLAVLAHPAQIPNLDRLLPDLVDVGLDGMEVYYATYSPATTEDMRRLARRFGLLQTGGSDFHGAGVTSSSGLGEVDVPYAAYAALAAAHTEGRHRQSRLV